MKLPIPIEMTNGVYREAEIRKPKLEKLVSANKKAKEGKIYAAVKTVCDGAVLKYVSDDGKEITDSVAIKSMNQKLPYSSAEEILSEVSLLLDPELEYVEGAYTCPVCRTFITCMLSNEDGIEIDTRDLLSDIPIRYCEKQQPIVVNLTEPIEFINEATKETLQKVSILKLSTPTLEDCIIAEAKAGSSDDEELQFAIYVEALKEIDGIEVDKRWKDSIGTRLFYEIEDPTDMKELSAQMSQFGRALTIEKKCPKCGKVFKVSPNRLSFFE